MKKFKIIFNLITVALTAGLLVIITLAWYVTNTQADVDGGVGRIADIDSIVDTVEYYNFKSSNSNTNTYTVRQYVKYTFGMNETREQMRFYYNEDDRDHPGELVNPAPTMLTGYDGGFQMNEFDFLKQELSKYLIRITLKQDKSLSSLQFVSSATHFIGYNTSGGDGSVTDVSSLSLSSVVKFGQLTNTPNFAENHSTVTFTDNVAYTHFYYGGSENTYSGAISTYKQTVASNLTPPSGQKQVINLLVDYNVDALNTFYGNNLSTSDDWGISPVFDLDFRIIIFG